MGERLPQLRAREVLRTLRRGGFMEKRQSGSHLIMYHPVTKVTVPIPMHNKPLDRGLLAGIIKEAGLTKDQFLKLLRM